VGSASDGGKGLWGSPLSLSDLVGESSGVCRVSVFSACLAQSLAEKPLGEWGSFQDNSIHSFLLLFFLFFLLDQKALPRNFSLKVVLTMARPVPAIKVFSPIWRRNFSASTSRSAINKLCDSAEDAVKNIKGSSTLLVGGFGFSGVPNTLINALHARPEVKDLTVVSNNAGMPGAGLGRCNVPLEVKLRGH
jgi:hypothetical protein